jgi:hypothetical protein
VKPVFRAIGASDVPEQIDEYRTRIRDGLDDWLKSGARAALASPVAYAQSPPTMTVPGAAVPAAPARVPGGAGPAPAVPVPAPAVAPAGPAVAPPVPGKKPPLMPRGALGPRRRPLPPGGVIAKPAYRFMDLYPANLPPEQPTVRVLAATVRDLTARGVRTIVFLAPVHLQAAKATGAYKDRNFPGAQAVVREATTANGGDFIDLAEALPQESYFVDRYTHFTAEGNAIVRDKVLDEVARIIGGAAE